MKRIRRRKAEGGRRNLRPRRAGFTLVELMVSVALAIIILTLFATIYSWSTETYSTQKGIRRNDQRSRMMVTVIQGDLKYRTFQDVVAFVPGQDSMADVGRFRRGDRKGYLSISENDPDNQTDDVLALTVDLQDSDSLGRFSGRAKVLFDPAAIDPRTGVAYTDTPTGWSRYLIDHPDQPEHDDGQVNVSGGIVGVLNHGGKSRAAEVVYFRRHGNLYRRMLLIRDPYDEGSSTDGGQPELITGAYSTALVRYDANGDNVNDPGQNGYFWRDFANSAYHKNSGALANRGPRFHGRSTSLWNDNNTAGATPNADPDFFFPRNLGIPQLRFGGSLNRTVPQLPREYVEEASGSPKFIGRFLSQETSDAAFLYPGSVGAPPDPTTNDPHVRTDLTYDSATGLVTQYSANTLHRGEDILMTNVHEFDIKVWDSQLFKFVDLGYDRNATGFGNGDFDRQDNRDPAVQAGTSWYWNRFDTWHPFQSATTSLGAAPYKPGSSVLGDAGERPLLAIQITIRFFDVNSKQMRQLTIQHSLKK